MRASQRSFYLLAAASFLVEIRKETQKEGKKKKREKDGREEWKEGRKGSWKR